MQQVYDKLREEDEKCQSALKAAQDRMQAISLGQFTTETGETATLQEQLIKCKAEVIFCNLTIKI